MIYLHALRIPALFIFQFKLRLCFPFTEVQNSTAGLLTKRFLSYHRSSCVSILASDRIQNSIQNLFLRSSDQDVSVVPLLGNTRGLCVCCPFLRKTGWQTHIKALNQGLIRKPIEAETQIEIFE